VKVNIDEDLCIGCGLCADTCPAVFEMTDDKAKVKANPVSKDAMECTKQATSDCPVEAIKVEQ